MNKITDVLVIGSGLAGLTAALAAVEAGCKTSLLCEGMGNLSISGGCIDFLGYDKMGQKLENPWTGLEALPPDHPYALLGKENIENAFNKVISLLADKGCILHHARDDKGNPANTMIPTIMGTLKPTYLLPQEINPQLLNDAKNILVIGIQGFRDCKPRLIIEQLRRYPGWEEKNYDSLVLPPPFKEKGRSLNALDIARATDRSLGREWLLSNLKGRGANYDVAFMPPILGVKTTSSIREEAPETLGCPIVELQCLPPAVAGLRLREAFMNILYAKGVQVFENAQVVEADVDGDHCISISVNASGRQVKHEAKAFVVATGGIIAGGVILGEGSGKEAIFGLPLAVPPNVDDWTEPEIFGSHFITRLGVPVNAQLNATIPLNGKILENVFFAGRTLGGYDYATEKSGHGVALVTGWRAGELAAQTAGCDVGATGSDGAAK